VDRMIIRDKDSRNQSSEQRWKIGSSDIVLSFLTVQCSPEKGRANIPKTKIIQKYIEEIILLRRISASASPSEVYFARVHVTSVMSLSEYSSSNINKVADIHNTF
jgi:hypothetical protein